MRPQRDDEDGQRKLFEVDIPCLPAVIIVVLAWFVFVECVRRML